MKLQFAVLKRIENNRAITPERDSHFLYQLQLGLLLALKERGHLDVMQFRYAAERLQQQRRIRAKDILRQ